MKIYSKKKAQKWKNYILIEEELVFRREDWDETTRFEVYGRM